MSEYQVVTFNPREGQKVDIPENVGRARIAMGPPSASGRHALATVVGSGEPVEMVCLSTREDTVDLADGAVVLGVEIPDNSHAEPRLWYCLPRSAYGGSD